MHFSCLASCLAASVTRSAAEKLALPALRPGSLPEDQSDVAACLNDLDEAAFGNDKAEYLKDLPENKDLLESIILPNEPCFFSLAGCSEAIAVSEWAVSSGPRSLCRPGRGRPLFSRRIGTSRSKRQN